jgi:glycosyltransferase involved in cell wall biosynthesis
MKEAAIDAERDAPAVTGMRQLKVVHLVQTLDVGGLEVVVAELADGLLGLGVETTVMAVDRLGPVAVRFPALPMVAVGARPGIDLRAVLRLARELRAREVDVLHTHNQRAHVFGLLASRIAGTPVLINTHHGRSEPDRPRGPLRRHLLARASQAIVTVSRDVEALARGRDGIQNTPVRTIYNGVVVGREPPVLTTSARARLRESLGLPPHALVIGSVGRLAPEKDYATLLRAFARVAATPAEAPPHLVLVGDGGERASLEQLAAGLGIAGCTRFLGFQSEVPRLLTAFDIYAQSSLTEGISLTILEAMAAALPVVVTAVGGNREILVEGTGVMVAPADPEGLASELLALAGDEMRRRSLGRAAHARVVEQFSRERMVRDHLQLYEQLTERS